MNKSSNQTMIWGFVILAAVVLASGYFFQSEGYTGPSATAIGEQAGQSVAAELVKLGVIGTSPVVTNVTSVSSSSVVLDDEFAMEQVFDEFDGDEEFYTCDGYEYSEDEVSFKVYESSVKNYSNGDIKLILDKVRFTFSDDSDDKDCKEYRSFEVFLDSDDIENGNYNLAEVEWN